MKAELLNGKYGPIFGLISDQYVGQSLIRYGEYCDHEIELFRHVIQPGWTVMDIGANMGALTVPLATLCKEVIGIEPQPEMFKLLTANMAVSGNCRKFTGFNIALGAEKRKVYVPDADYSVGQNFGAIPVDDKSTGIPTRMLTIDILAALGHKPNFIKIDVEGWEESVLKGGINYIEEHEPVLYVENDKPDRSESLVKFITEKLGYRAYWHITPLFNRNNFFGASENAFGSACSFNMLCVPKKYEVQTDLTPVTKDNALPPTNVQVFI